MLSIREKKALLALSDLTQVVISSGLALVVVLLVSKSAVADLLTQMRWVAMMGAVLLPCAYLNDCLDITSLNSSGRYIRRWVISWVITISIYLLAFFIFGRPGSTVAGGIAQPRLIPAIFALTVVFLVPLGRLLLERILALRNAKKPCVVMGAGGSGRHFVEDVAGINAEWEIIALLDDDPQKVGNVISGVKVLGSCSKLLELVQKHDVQEVVLAISHEMSRDVIDSLMICFERGIDVVPVLMATERTLQRIPINHLGDKWLPTTFWASSSMPLFYRVLKRTLDIVISSLLLVFSLPIILMASLITKLGSQGPAFYFQERVGIQGRTFRIAKIRTMIVNAEAEGARWSAQNDHRVTPVGRFLRATRIDELPQLWNILRGDMSIIGPRPERPEFIHRLAQEIPYYRARLSIRPGLTGWAQIMYRYGNTVDDARIKLEYDLYYIKNRSLLLDFLILIKTLKTVVLMRGV